MHRYMINAGFPETREAVTHWLELEFDDNTQQAFLAATGGMLNRADHVARMDRLLWAGRTNEARRMLPLVDGNRLLWAEARLALAGRAGDAETRLAQVPHKMPFLQHFMKQHLQEKAVTLIRADLGP